MPRNEFHDSVRQAADRYASHVVHVQSKYSLSPEVSLGILQTVLNYDLTMKQMRQNPVQDILAGANRGKISEG